MTDYDEIVANASERYKEPTRRSEAPPSVGNASERYNEPSRRLDASPAVGNASKRYNEPTRRSEASPTAGDASERHSTSSRRSVASPTFVNLKEPIQIRRDKLPHWHQAGKTVFATFRLADSLPQEKLAELPEVKRRWEEEHPQPWSKEVASAYDHEIRNITEKWLDKGYGSCILCKPDIRKIVYNALLHYDGKLYQLHHFVIMPNHVHLLASPMGRDAINKAIGSVKQFTAHSINKALGRSGSVWQRLIFDHLVRNEAYYNSYVTYIKNNPKHLDESMYTLYDGTVGDASERHSTSSRRLEASPTVANQ